MRQPQRIPLLLLCSVGLTCLAYTPPSNLTEQKAKLNDQPIFKNTEEQMAGRRPANGAVVNPFLKPKENRTPQSQAPAPATSRAASAPATEGSGKICGTDRWLKDYCLQKVDDVWLVCSSLWKKCASTVRRQNP